MTYACDNLRLEKGMYNEAGLSFTQVLEAADPSENYWGTPLEGLDAYQRQLKRFDIRVKGSRSDVVEKFFRTTETAVLFPEFVARVVRQGIEEDDVLPSIAATITQVNGSDYRSIAAISCDNSEGIKSEEGGAYLLQTTVRTQDNLVKLHKRGRMLVSTYNDIRFQRLDLFSVTLRQIGSHIARMHLEDAIRTIIDGDGNDNPVKTFSIGTFPISGGSLSYTALLDFWGQFDPYTMNTLLMPTAVMLDMLRISELQNSLLGLNFQGTKMLIPSWVLLLCAPMPCLPIHSLVWTGITLWKWSVPAM